MSSKKGPFQKERIVFQAPIFNGHSFLLMSSIANSHMLVSKIKPCMSQYKQSNGESANGPLKHLIIVYLMVAAAWIRLWYFWS